MVRQYTRKGHLQNLKKRQKEAKQPKPLPPVPSVRRDIRTDVHVAFQLFNVNLDEEWDVLNMGITRQEFDNWFKQENMPVYDVDRFTETISEWLTQFLQDPFRNREQFNVAEGGEVRGETVKPQTLIPLVIDVTSEGRRFRDQLLWDPGNKVDIEEFVKQMCRDKKLTSSHAKLILESLKKQMHRFESVPQPAEEDVEEDKQRGFIVIDFVESYRGIRVKDKFLWNPYDEVVSPEEFAHQYTLDVGLSSDWAVLLAHCIRAKVHRHRASIAMKQASGYDYSRWQNFVRTCEELDRGVWEPTVLKLTR